VPPQLFIAEVAENAERRREEETEEALERDYMDYRITWIEAYMSSFLIHVILQSM
jgi:hypothetical protein